jgi:hypothetical protein
MSPSFEEEIERRERGRAEGAAAWARESENLDSAVALENEARSNPAGTAPEDLFNRDDALLFGEFARSAQRRGYPNALNAEFGRRRLRRSLWWGRAYILGRADGLIESGFSWQELRRAVVYCSDGRFRLCKAEANDGILGTLTLEFGSVPNGVRLTPGYFERVSQGGDFRGTNLVFRQASLRDVLVNCLLQ